MRLVIFFLSFICCQALADTPNFVRFVRNDGQWEKDVRFKAELPNGHLYLKDNALHYVFYDGSVIAARHAASTTAAIPSKMAIHGVVVHLEGANPHPTLLTKQKSEEKRNYFLGNVPSQWATNVPAFGEVIYQNIYPGIDLRLYTYGGSSLKYEFLVAPQADVSQIRLRYEGANSLQLDKGNLIVSTNVNTIKEVKPYSYQQIEKRSSEVESNFHIQDQTVTFSFPEGYDHSQALVIDPVLIFSSFSGLVADNWGHTACYDAQGNLYSIGSANLSIQQLIGGGYDENPQLWDVAVLKFNPQGTKLLFVTYLGGQYSEVPHSSIVNSKGEILIFGTTSSRNFPMITTSYDNSFNGGQNITAVNGMDYPVGSDIFIAKIGPNGDQLLGATYLGGSGNDGLNLTRSNLTIRNYGDEYRGEIVTDAQDNVYIASVSGSSDFPLMNTSQTTRKGTYDAVIAKLDKNLSTLLWSTYLGGDGYDAGYSIKVATSGNIYVCGVTNSTNLRGNSSATVNKTTLTGSEDGWVAKYASNFQQVAVSYVGTDGVDAAQLLDLDADENVHIIGLTNGKYAVSTGVYQNANSGQFIHALDKDLNKTVFSTVVGSGRGVPDIIPTAFLISDCGNIYFSGWGGRVNEAVTSQFGAQSSTNGLPVTSDAYRTTTDGNNFYIAMLEKGAKSLLYATFFGTNNSGAGDHVDGGTCRFDKKGFIYHTACACNRGSSVIFPTSLNAWSKTNGSLNCNNAAFKFDIDTLAVSFDVFSGTQKDVVTGCAPLNLQFVNTSIGGKTYEWDIAGLAKSTSASGTSYTFDKGGEYIVRLKGTNPLSCNREKSAQKTIKVTPADFNIIGPQRICTGGSVQLTASGGKTYKWTPATGLSKTDIANPVATPQSSTTYSVEMTNEFGCVSTKTVTVEVDVSFQPDFTFEKTFDCGQPVTLLLENKTANADRLVWSMGNGDTLKTASPPPYVYKQAGTYTITLKAYRGNCELVTSKPVEIEPAFSVANVITPNGDGRNDTFVINQKGIRMEIYNRWGKLMFQADNYANDWGKGVPNGTYYYLITTPSGSKCKGWIEVME